MYIIITLYSTSSGVEVPTFSMLKGGVATDINHGVCELRSEPVISLFLHFALLLYTQFLRFLCFPWLLWHSCHLPPYRICCVYIRTYMHREPLPSVIHASCPSKKVFWVWLIVNWLRTYRNNTQKLLTQSIIDAIIIITVLDRERMRSCFTDLVAENITNIFIQRWYRLQHRTNVVGLQH